MPLGSTVALATERLSRPVEGMHRTIANRWFDAVGPIAAPVRFTHDVIASAVYSGIRLTGSVAGAGLDLGLELREETSDGMRSFIAGVLGPDLGRHSSAFHTPMEVRGDAEVQGGRLIVLVHGLTETERIFDGPAGLREAVDGHPDLTAVPIRYHTGLPVTENGARLAELLEETTAQWPVDVTSIVLVGRSMGGLVAREACQAGIEAEHEWTQSVTDVVTIGTPHHGSWVEAAAELAARGLGIARETRPLAGVIASRSEGIKDLRRGGTQSLPEGIAHHFIAGAVTSNRRNPLGVLFGDGVVGQKSALGHRLGPTNAVAVPSAAHPSLHHHPDVVAAVMTWATASEQQPEAFSGESTGP